MKAFRGHQQLANYYYIESKLSLSIYNALNPNLYTLCLHSTSSTCKSTIKESPCVILFHFQFLSTVERTLKKLLKRKNKRIGKTLHCKRSLRT